MLKNLQVRDFAIVDRIAVEFDCGMTVLTGETGAGKSILVDALGLVLGERGSAQAVRNGARRAEFSAEFDVRDLAGAAAWLEDNALDEDGTCLLRRVIGEDGRSRAFINGNAVTMQQLKALGDYLLDIHGQHFHQSLGRKSVQRDLLDHFGALRDLRRKTETAFADWKSLRDRLEQLQAAESDRASRLDLLGFQLSELEALDISQTEHAELLTQRQKLQHGSRLVEGVAAALAQLSDAEDGNANDLLADARRSLEAIIGYDTALGEAAELLDSASIQIAEASEQLRRYGESVDLDPARRDWVEERLDAIQAIARKHRIQAEELPALQDRIRDELADLSNAEERSAALLKDVEAAATAFGGLAEELSAGRQVAAKKFSAAVTEVMQALGMPGGKFEVSVKKLPADDPRPWGIDSIEFLISANPGQPPLPMSRIASGGELSRMGLAIQVVASDGSPIPTMVFDEVDSGVGGRVAEMVGRHLRELGAHRQVLCVTHLPQVASLADSHFRVSKVTDGKATRTGVHRLGKEERIEELARMLGGVEITQKTLEHAAEMLAGAERKLA